MSNLRSRLIRLAHEKPELRSQLLPILKKASAWEKTLKLGPNMEATLILEGPNWSAIQKMAKTFGQVHVEIRSWVFLAQVPGFEADGAESLFSTPTEAMAAAKKFSSKAEWDRAGNDGWINIPLKD